MSTAPVPMPDRAPEAPQLPAAVSASIPGRFWYVLASLAVLLPCYWQPRIQGGDLSSHIYNVWLAGLIRAGRTEGLTIVPLRTNVLFDWILESLFRWFGADWAQRLAVSAAVLIFAWGCFAFVSTLAGRRAWPMMPCLALLAYGWVFHMGFFNFYLSLGLCFWSLALAWKPRPARLIGAVALFFIAYAAHALPVAWAVAVWAYSWVANRLPPRVRPWLMALSLALMAAAHIAVRRALVSVWSVNQLSSATGADQAWVFDGKYFLLTALLLLIWGALFVELLQAQGGRGVASSVPLHWSVLTAAGIFILPSTVLIPGYQHALVYIAERMSLAVAVCFCALLATAPIRKFPHGALAALALIFFAFLFRDERRLNHFEDRVEQAVDQLPSGARVVSPIIDPELRADALTHMVDRACLARCFSYANYEASTAQFRIRVVRPNSYVVADYGDSWNLQNGKYVIKQGDPRLVSLSVSDQGQVQAQSLQPGVRNAPSFWLVLRDRKPPKQ